MFATLPERALVLHPFRVFINWKVGASNQFKDPIPATKRRARWRAREVGAKAWVIDHQQKDG
jgi:hypothetical protein